MAFKLLSAYVALLFVFNRSLEVQAATMTDIGDLGALSATHLGRAKPTESLHPSRKFENIIVHDVSDDVLERIGRTEMQQLPALPVPGNFYGLLVPVLRGNGALYQREGKVQNNWNVWKTKTKNQYESLEAYHAGRHGWTGKYPLESQPEVIDGRYANDETWVKFEEARFPVALPSDTKHMYCFVRGPVTTPECFEPRGKDKVPKEYGIWKENLQAYIDFINAHDAFGTNVKLTKEQESQFAEDLMESEVKNSLELQKALVRGDEEEKIEAKYRKALEVYHEKLHDENSTEAAVDEALEATRAIHRPYLARAKRAMKWATRNINELGQAKFPGQEFDWLVASPWIRTQHVKLIDFFVKEADNQGALHGVIEAPKHEALAIP